MRVLREELSVAARNAKNATDAVKSITEAHKCFKLEEKDSRLCITACGPAQIYAEVLLDAEELAGWKPVLVNAEVFTNILAKLPDSDSLEITQDDRMLTIKAKGVRLTLNIVQTDFPQKEDWSDVRYEGKVDFLEDLGSVIHAVSVSAEKNPMMSSVHMCLSKTGYRVEALDGHRISRRERDFAKESEEEAPVKFLIQGVLVNRILRMINGKECTIKVDNTKVAFEGEDTFIQCPISNQEYFKVDQMFDAIKMVSEAIIDKENLSSAMDLILLYGTSSDKAPAKFSLKDGTLTISSVTSAFGDTNSSPKARVSGVDIEIMLRADYVQDAVKSLPGDEVRILFSNPKAPVLMGGDGKYEMLLPVYDKK